MIATSHVIIGGAVGVIVGTVTQNPAAALAAGVVSHFICDSLPHLDTPPNAKYLGDEIIWDRTLYTFAILDSLIAMIAVLIIWYFKFDFHFFSVFAWGALGGYLPDLVDNFPLWNHKLHRLLFFKQFHAFHIWIHDNWRFRFPMPQYWILGVATQLITGLPCLYYLFRI
jgi:membrane-bound metal-dependent hydrolase YbcI (DUF457 family)